MHVRTYQKHLLRMTNMRTLSMPTEKRQQNAYQLNKELNLEFHGRHKQLEKKRADVTTASHVIGGIQTISILRHLRRYKMNELTYTERNKQNTSKNRSIRLKIQEDRQSTIVWQTVNKMSSRTSNALFITESCQPSRTNTPVETTFEIFLENLRKLRMNLSQNY